MMNERMTEDVDWRDGMNAFREDAKHRIVDLLNRISELELSIEDIRKHKSRKPRKARIKEDPI